MDLMLGIDTSCYTTSLAVIDAKGILVSEKRLLLEVKRGEKGLQQSEALFQHLKNLPVLAEDVFRQIDRQELKGIACSSKPRPQKDSYMPVFLAGDSFARVIAGSLGLPFFSSTHQEGHLLAGLWSAQKLELDKFLAVHLSGGTTELLLVEKEQVRELPLFRIEKLGGTTDLHAGQLIDRIGVKMGLPFPAGPHLEKIADQANNEPDGLNVATIKSAVKGYDLSFSGAETMAYKLLDSGLEQAIVARQLENCIAKTIEKIIRRAVESRQIFDVLVVGGVAANKYIRVKLRQRLEHRAVGAKLYFAQPYYSTDNAVGIALAGWKMMTGG